MQLYRKTRDKDASIYRSIDVMCKQFATFEIRARACDRKESVESIEGNPSVINLSLDELAPAVNKERLGPSEPQEVD